MASAANAARSGLEILGKNGGDSTSSSHSAPPAASKVIASATASAEYLTSPSTTTGSRHASATAMKVTKVSHARPSPVRCDRAFAIWAVTFPQRTMVMAEASRHGAPSTTSAGAATARTPNCTACANTKCLAAVPPGGKSTAAAIANPASASHGRRTTSRRNAAPLITRTGQSYAQRRAHVKQVAEGVGAQANGRPLVEKTPPGTSNASACRVLERADGHV